MKGILRAVFSRKDGGEEGSVILRPPGRRIGLWKKDGKIHRPAHRIGIILEDKAAPLSGRETDGWFLQINGLSPDTIGILDQFHIGRSILQVTSVQPDNQLECRILRGGTIGKGNAVQLHQRPLRARIITLSDRASRKEYRDASGPAIQSILEDFFASRPWHWECSRAIIPDVPRRLRRHLRRGARKGVDILLTTGGTGVGPRDITPETVMKMGAREIPGIMDHIRLKYGQRFPNALLSRSIATVYRRTLIFCLPGSPRAVREYTTDLLPVLEHTLRMVHGLGH